MNDGGVDCLRLEGFDMYSSYRQRLSRGFLGLVLGGVLSLYLPAEAQADRLAIGVPDLVKACSTPDQEWIGFCNGYIQAAVDFIEFEKLKVCIPTGTTRNDIFKRVLPIISPKTSASDDNAFFTLVSSIAGSYGCE